MKVNFSARPSPGIKSKLDSFNKSGGYIPLLPIPTRPRPFKPKKLQKRIRRMTAYNPSLAAVYKGLVGRKPRMMTGLNIRRIPPERLGLGKKRKKKIIF